MPPCVPVSPVVKALHHRGAPKRQGSLQSGRVTETLKLEAPLYL